VKKKIKKNSKWLTIGSLMYTKDLSFLLVFDVCLVLKVCFVFEVCLPILLLFGILLPIQVYGFAATPSFVPIFTTISTPHIVALVIHFNALIWLLIKSSFPLFFGPHMLFPWLWWFYRFHTLVNWPLIWAKHRINPGGIGLSVCIHQVTMAGISLGFSFMRYIAQTACGQGIPLSCHLLQPHVLRSRSITRRASWALSTSNYIWLLQWQI
jgi:hypothetical protein